MKRYKYRSRPDSSRKRANQTVLNRRTHLLFVRRAVNVLRTSFGKGSVTFECLIVVTAAYADSRGGATTRTTAVKMNETDRAFAARKAPHGRRDHFARALNATWK